MKIKKYKPIIETVNETTRACDLKLGDRIVFADNTHLRVDHKETYDTTITLTLFHLDTKKDWQLIVPEDQKFAIRREGKRRTRGYDLKHKAIVHHAGELLVVLRASTTRFVLVDLETLEVVEQCPDTLAFYEVWEEA